MPDPALTLREDYFDAWNRNDLERILSFYSDAILMRLPAGTLAGKPTGPDRFVRLFLAAFHGSKHTIRSGIASENLAAVEWDLDAPAGANAPFRASGCSFYGCNISARVILGFAAVGRRHRFEALLGSRTG